MCGIAGEFSISGKPPDPEIVKQMCNEIVYRGPDDHGLEILPGAVLGHNRLAIIDLGGGHQPLCNEDRSIWIVFNGEIYNFQGIAEELKGRGHILKSRCDTEVIVHLYEEMGTRVVERLRGMFAFAIADIKNGCLFIARDRLGKKPVVYARLKDSLVFASELKCLLKHPEVKKDIRLSSIHDYLTNSFIPSPSTIFKDVYKLPPAHCLELKNGNLRIWRYWDLDYRQKTDLSEKKIESRILELLEESTKIRLISDVPLGAFLSGGIDSSAVVAMMSRSCAGKVKTFNIGFDDDRHSESRDARLVAGYFGTDHHEFIVRPDAFEVLPGIIWYYNEPYADFSCIPTYYVAKMTRQKVTVALSGDGGDESFGGYHRHYTAYLTHKFLPVPGVCRKAIIPNLMQAESIFPAMPRNFLRKTRRYLEAVEKNPDHRKRHARWLSFFSNEDKDEIYADGFKAAINGEDSYNYMVDIFDRSCAKDIRDQTFYVDIMSYLPEDLLVKMDIASMANSLEVRSPFLDHQLIEFSASIPPEMKISILGKKRILKKSLKSILPEEILRKKKRGFHIPIEEWFRNELKEKLYEILLDPASVERGYFKKEIVKKLLDDHMSRRADNETRLYTLLALELWHRTFMDKEKPEIITL